MTLGEMLCRLPEFTGNMTINQLRDLYIAMTGDIPEAKAVPTAPAPVDECADDVAQEKPAAQITVHEKHKRRSKVTPEMEAKITELIRDGQNNTQIAEIIGVTPTTIAKYRDRAQVAGEVKPREPKRRPIDRGKVFALAKAGRDVDWIADDIGRDKAEVETVLEGKD